MRVIAALAAIAMTACVATEAVAAEPCPAPSPADSPKAVKPSPFRIGVALGSGSVHGLAHIGVLEELEAHGLDVKVVSGTSVGAVVGSLWASGIEAREIETLSRDAQWETQARPTWLAMLRGGPDIEEMLAPHFRGRPIEAWPRRFGAVATNLANGHGRVFMSGDAALAVHASSAVPMRSSVVIGKERFGDGALVQPIPVDAARALGADFVIAVDVAYRPYEEPPNGLGADAFQAMHILVNSLAARQARDADFALRLDLHEAMNRCGAASLVARGREAMRNAWPELERALAARSGRSP